jgi:hypothetical protein
MHIMFKGSYIMHVFHPHLYLFDSGAGKIHMYEAGHEIRFYINCTRKGRNFISADVKGHEIDFNTLCIGIHRNFIWPGSHRNLEILSAEFWKFYPDPFMLKCTTDRWNFICKFGAIK